MLRLKARDANLETQWKQSHPFRPNVNRISKSGERNTKSNIDFKSSKCNVAIERHLRNLYDLNTQQRLYEPKISQFDHNIIHKAYKVRYNKELEEKARAIDKRLYAVFRFFSLDKNIIKIQDLDLLYMKNECIIMLKEILIGIVRGKNSLNYSGFVDVILENNLLDAIDKTYEFIQGNKTASKSRKRVSKCPNKSSKSYEHQIKDIAHKELGKLSPVSKIPEKKKTPKATINYCKLMK